MPSKDPCRLAIAIPPTNYYMLSSPPSDSAIPHVPPASDGGHCLCQGVVFYLDGPSVTDCAGSICYCHCMMCNHAVGSTAPGAIAVPLRNLKFKSRRTLQEYESSPGIIRSFCNECGCTLFMQYVTMEPNTIWIYASTLDDELQNSERFVQLMKNSEKATHIFMEKKAQWYDVPDDGIPRSNDGTGWIVDSCKPSD